MPLDVNQAQDDLEDGASGASSSGRVRMRRTTTPVCIPSGCWPYQMTASFAAGFAGEPSVETFLAKCGPGRRYPACKRLPGGSMLMWRRSDLERAIDAAYDEDGGGGYF